MNSKLSCNPQQPAPVTSRLCSILFYAILCALAATERANASSDAPQWMAIRNASDPQMRSISEKEKAAKIYEQYGYWTTIPSVSPTSRQSTPA